MDAGRSGGIESKERSITHRRVLSAPVCLSKLDIIDPFDLLFTSTFLFSTE